MTNRTSPTIPFPAAAAAEDEASSAENDVAVQILADNPADQLTVGMEDVNVPASVPASASFETHRRPNKRPRWNRDDSSEKGQGNDKMGANHVEICELPFAHSFEEYLEEDGYLRYRPRTPWIQAEHFTLDEDGSTILIVAVRSGKVDAAKAIIEAIYEYSVQNQTMGREEGRIIPNLVRIGNGSEVASISSLSSSSRHNNNNNNNNAFVHNHRYGGGGGGGGGPNNNVTPTTGQILNGNVNHVNKHGALALTVAAQRGYTSLVYLLITKGGADINAHSNANGTTALIQSSHFGNYDIVRMLLDHGALPEKANKKETTALMRASQEGHVNIVEALLSHNANVNRRNHERMTSLMLASQRGHEDVVQVLIAAGASQVLNERTSQNSTALMLACKRGHQRVVYSLLSAGAELYLRDSRGRTARDIAIRKGFKSIAKELTPCLQNHLIRMKLRENRTAIMVKLWFLMDQSRCLVAIPNKRALSIQRVKELFDSSDGGACITNDLSTSALIQSFTLPFPLFLNIASYIPLPSAWGYLIRTIFVGRCHVDPNASIEGLLDLIDEILLDANVSEAFHELEIPSPLGFTSWDSWRPVATFGRSPKWPTFSALACAQDARRAASFFGIFCNRPALIKRLNESPYKMPQSLSQELCDHWDIQSFSRRVTRGVTFEPTVAMSLLHLANRVLNWHENRFSNAHIVELADLSPVVHL